MQKRSIWAVLLGIQGARVVNVLQVPGGLTVRVELFKARSGRCPECGERCSGFDSGGDSTWRFSSLGPLVIRVVCALRRVSCPVHGVVHESVPWARRGSTFSRAFEDTVAWLSARTDRTTVSKLLRVTWSTVTNMIERVVVDQRKREPPRQLLRLGIDEVSYRKGHRYLTVVVDHDTGHLVFAGVGKDAEALRPFFEAMSPEARAAIVACSMDASAAFKAAVREWCPNARISMDPFHVVQWMTQALDEVRRRLWRELRAGDDMEAAAALKSMRFVLLKNQKDLSRQERDRLSELRRLNSPLYSAHLLKEQLRQVFITKGQDGIALLKGWLKSARSCKVDEILKVANAIEDNKEGIEQVLISGLSNARTESMNNQFKLLTRLARGFRTPQAAIAMAFLKLGGLCPDLPFA